MKPNTQKIINELIAIDPSLKSKKQELEKLISKLIKSKPNFEINQAFVVELKENLYKKSEQKKENFFSTFFKIKNWQSFGSGAILTALILTPLFYSMWGIEKKLPLGEIDDTKKSTQILSTNERIDGKEKKEFLHEELVENENNDFDESVANSGFGGLARNAINVESLEKEAFGNLSSSQDGGQNESANFLPSTEKQEITNDSKVGTYSKTPLSSDMKMPYNPTKYEYIYEDELKLDQTEITVFKKQTSIFQINANQLLNALNLELIDSSIFQNITAQNISIKEDRPFGYTINLSKSDGSASISIYKNWEKWSDPIQNCQTSECYKKNQLTSADIPKDEKLIKIANTFIQKLKIDMSPYGKPVVKQNEEMLRLGNKENAYIPEEISVVYPLLIEGQEILDESGNPTGLDINIDIRHQKAAGLNGLTLQQYDSAKYETVDLEKLKIAIKKGTYHQDYDYSPEDAKIVKIKLGKPKQILTKIWHWDSNKRKNNEMLVPALHFPILEKPKEIEDFYKKSIVIPLANDLY